MFQKVMRMSLLVMSTIVLLGGEVTAQFFDGWGWSCCSEVTGEIDLIKVPDPEEKPSIVVVKALLKDIEVICKHGQDRMPINAGTRRAEASKTIEEEDITSWKYKHNRTFSASIEIGLGANALRDAEEDAQCAKPYWRVVPGSAAPKTLVLTMQSFRCVPESKHDQEPCFQGDDDKWRRAYTSDEPAQLSIEKTPIDSVLLLCTLKNGISRDGDEPGHNEYYCKERRAEGHDDGRE